MTRGAWKVFSIFLDDFVKAKVHVHSDDYLPKLKEHIDMNQLEQRFGGDMPNVTSYFPPRHM